MSQHVALLLNWAFKKNCLLAFGGGGQLPPLPPPASYGPVLFGCLVLIVVESSITLRLRGGGVEFDMKYHMLYNFRTFTPFTVCRKPQKRMSPILSYCKVLLSKLDWFLSTIDVIWEKIAALIEFS